MTDRLLELANHPWTAPLVRGLGLPQPARLRRATGASSARELAGRAVIVSRAGDGFAEAAAREAIQQQGGTVCSQEPADAFLLDATGCRRAADLDTLYALARDTLPRLNPGARVLLLADAAPANPEAAACARAVEGFMRALGKEIGRRGGTANALQLQAQALAGLAPVLAFFCSDRCAYVSGQVLALREVPALPAVDGPVLAGRTALVTGAAGGIGAATARRLAADGAFVICLDVPQAGSALTAIATELRGAALALDLTAADAAPQVAVQVASRGGLDVLVHNAGITRDRTLARMSPAEWGSVLDVNLRAVLALDRALDEAGLLRAGGREICLSSISGIAGNAGQANYSAAKAALLGYVRARAQQLAPRGITVNAVAPGFIETGMTQRIPFMVREVGRRLNALAQGGQPQDVAEAIAFLARPDAQALTGQTLRVCGQSFLGA